MVTSLPYECILVHPSRPGLVYSGYARVYFARSVEVYRHIAMVVLNTRRRSHRSEIVINVGDSRKSGMSSRSTLYLEPTLANFLVLVSESRSLQKLLRP